MRPFTTNQLMDRGAISTVDVIMTFAVVVALIGIAPWLYDIIEMLQTEADPLTGALLALFVPLLFVAVLLSMGVSADS